MNTADDAGFKDHPQRVILSFAPDAHSFEPVAIADCWLFESKEIENAPSFFVPLSDK